MSRFGADALKMLWGTLGLIGLSRRLAVPEQPERFRLIAYICDDSSMSMAQDMGTKDFETIYSESPIRCRFCVVQAGDEYWLIDMLGALVRDKSESILARRIVVGEHVVFPDEDSALMAGRFSS